MARSLLVNLVICVVLVAAATGCVPVQPLEKLQSSIPDSEWVQVGDQRIHVVQQGQGPPVLLLHGFGGSSYSWRKVVPDLARHYRVVAIDLHGFGWSDRPSDLESYSRAGQVRLVEDVMDALGIGRADLIGHSYGGALAMSFASSHPDRVRSLVLANSAAPSYPVTRRKWLAAVPPLAFGYVRGLGLRDAFIRRVLERSYFSDAVLTPEDLAEYRKRLRVQGAVRAYRGLTSPFHREVDPFDVELENIHVPVLVLWGAEDKLIPLAKGREAAARLPRYKFVEIADCGHAPMEERPEAFVGQVLDFLSDPERALGPEAEGAEAGFVSGPSERVADPQFD